MREATDHDVLIFRGLPGSGKTTAAEAACKVVYSTDDFWTGMDGVYRFDSSRLQEAHAWNFRRFLHALRTGAERPIGVANSACEAWEVAPYVMGALAYGAKPQVVTCLCTPQEARARQTKEIPPAVFDGMRRRFESVALPLYWDQRTLLTSAREVTG